MQSAGNTLMPGDEFSLAAFLLCLLCLDSRYECLLRVPPVYVSTLRDGFAGSPPPPPDRGSPSFIPAAGETFHTG